MTYLDYSTFPSLLYKIKKIYIELLQWLVSIYLFCFVETSDRQLGGGEAVYDGGVRCCWDVESIMTMAVILSHTQGTGAYTQIITSVATDTNKQGDHWPRSTEYINPQDEMIDMQ